MDRHIDTKMGVDMSGSHVRVHDHVHIYVYDHVHICVPDRDYVHGCVYEQRLVPI